MYALRSVYMPRNLLGRSTLGISSGVGRYRRGLGSTPWNGGPADPTGPTSYSDPCAYMGVGPSNGYCVTQDYARPFGSTYAEWMALKPQSDPIRAIDNCDPYPWEFGVGDTVTALLSPPTFNGQVTISPSDVFYATGYKNGAQQWRVPAGTYRNVSGGNPVFTTPPFTASDFGDWTLRFDVAGCQARSGIHFRVSPNPQSQIIHGLPGPVAPPQVCDNTGCHTIAPCPPGTEYAGGTACVPVGGGSGGGGTGGSGGGGGSTPPSAPPGGTGGGSTTFDPMAFLSQNVGGFPVWEIGAGVLGLLVLVSVIGGRR